MKVKKTEAFWHNLLFARAAAEPRLTPTVEEQKNF